MSLQISIREFGDVTILDLCGRSTLNGESKLLSDCLKELVANGARKLLLSLKDLTQVDSSGVSVMIWTYTFLKEQGGDLKMLRPSGRVLKVFRLFHVLEIIPSFENENQALASFQPQCVLNWTPPGELSPPQRVSLSQF